MAVEPARADLEAARTLHRHAGSRAGEGLAIATLGLTFLMTGEPDRARELLDEALAIQTAAGYLWGEGHASLYLGLTSTRAIHRPPPSTTAMRSSACGRIATRTCCRTR